MRTGKVDLRKVDGDVNPADLLTKHSLSRERLLKLVELFNCKYTGGRAVSAPQLRRGASSKTTLADSDELNAADRPSDRPTSSDRPPAAAAVEGKELEIGESVRPPIIPHLLFSKDELDYLFPPLAAPDAECLDDVHERNAESEDSVLQHGLRLAEGIQDDMVANGRRRRPLDQPQATARTAFTALAPTTTATVSSPSASTSPPSSSRPGFPRRHRTLAGGAVAGGVRKSGVPTATIGTTTIGILVGNYGGTNGSSCEILRRPRCSLSCSSFDACSDEFPLAQAKLPP